LRLAVLKEAAPGETRVALLPDAVKSLIAKGLEIAVESGAGLASGHSDEAYALAGATLTSDRASLLSSADILPVVNAPPAEDQRRIKPGAIAIGFLRPLDHPAALLPAIESGVTLLAVELVPRITRAQAMDALSSMATVAGYKAVILAADTLPRLFPMLMTAL
jgi:NAD(P) transhydrogenase subunit alpha